MSKLPAKPIALLQPNSGYANSSLLGDRSQLDLRIRIAGA
jgi:hypothetical protein